MLSGGSNKRNEIRYTRFYPVIEKLKRDFPRLRVAIHTALTDEAGAKEMEAAGVDVAMLDIIGAQETIREVYHLDRPVAEAMSVAKRDLSPGDRLDVSALHDRRGQADHERSCVGGGYGVTQDRGRYLHRQ